MDTTAIIGKALGDEYRRVRSERDAPDSASIREYLALSERLSAILDAYRAAFNALYDAGQHDAMRPLMDAFWAAVNADNKVNA